MPYKTKEERKKYYDKNKDEINAQRREYGSRPEVREKLNKKNLEWRHNNLEKARKISNKAKKKYENKAKRLVLEYYGRKCSCCNEDNILFLTIDHINGGGRKHREKIKSKICVWLFKNNFPDGFQTLCFNCNWGKHINGGTCPHKDKNNS